ncbi:sodium:solute symporter [Steroidobacter flavus]|uniref:sodium:solute symporter n=1 Tax=Steroidobacter flavus TaxID=1842136 RepID=UPI0036D2C935
MTRAVRLLLISVLLLLAGTAPTRADNLVSLDIASLPAAPEPVAHLAAINDTLIAWGTTGTWRFDQDQQSWRRLRESSNAGLLGVAGDGQVAYVLIGSQAVERIERVSLTDQQPAAIPPLPEPLFSAYAAVAGTKVWLFGVDANRARRFVEIDLAAVNPSWTTHEAWPGTADELTSAVEQINALFITVREREGQPDRILQWKAGEGWKDRGVAPAALVPGSASALGQAHVLYVSNATPSAVVTFHTITGSWATLAEAPNAAQARATTGWKNGFVWLRTSEDGTQQLSSGQVRSTNLLLQPLDWVMIVTYLVSMIGMGMYFYLKEKRNSTSDFFVGGRKIPFWAAGVSLYAANTSSISYIAIPAKAFETNWQYLTNNLIAVLGLMFVAVWIVPLLRRLNLMSVFTYLETRFHPTIRTMASALCILMQVGARMSVIMFLPSLAIATTTGIDVKWSILIMGVFTMIYTAMGGMKAVIWTDFVQLIVKMGGIVFAIVFIAFMVKGGFGEMAAIAAAEDKTKLFDFSFDLTKATVWGFLFLVLFDVVLTFPKDQVLMQRVLSTESAKEAGRSVWTFAAIMIPGGFMFYMVGTALYAFYKTHPERLNPLLPIDSIFPLFIAAELPMGVRGLIIAGILAAAMATLSSIMNSVATLASVDFYEKLVKNPDPKVSVRFAEWMTVVTGVAGMGLALILSRYDIHSLFDVSIELAGLLGGGFAGAYTLGMFTKRANWQGVAIGIGTSIVITTVAWSMNLVHPYFYLAISILLCICVGYVASLFFPAPSVQSLEGLTIYGQRERPVGVALTQNE